MPHRSRVRSRRVEDVLKSCFLRKWPARRAAQAIFDETSESVSVRSVSRWMSHYQAKQEEARKIEIAQQQRLYECEAIGRGLGAVQIGVAGVAEILKSTGPEFRQRQAEGLTDLLQQFLERPTPNLLCGLAVGLHCFLLGDSLLKSLRGNDA